MLLSLSSNTLVYYWYVVCVLPSHLCWTPDMWTHQPRSHRISPTSFCGACLNFYREKEFSLAFPWSTVKSNFVFPRTNRSPLVGHDTILTLQNHSVVVSLSFFELISVLWRRMCECFVVLWYRQLPLRAILGLFCFL